MTPFKKIFLKIIILVLAPQAFAQSVPPHIEWAKCFGGTDEDQALCIEKTSDKGFITAGESYSVDGDVNGHHDTANYNEDFWIVKIDSIGNLQWEKSLGGDSDEIAYNIKQTPDGGYIVAGSSNSFNGDVTVNHGRKDYWIVRLDANGKIIWQKSFGGSDDDEAYSIDLTSDGGYIAAGFSFSIDRDTIKRDSTGLSDYWVVKMDKDGNLEWEKSYGGSASDIAWGIRQTKDNGYFVTGYSESQDGEVTGNHGKDDYWIIKIDSIGNLKWEKSYGGSSTDWAYSSDLTKDGGLVVVGLTFSVDGDVSGNHGQYDFWVIKIDSTGKLAWQKSLGGSNGDAANSVKQTSDGGYIIVGNTLSNDGDVSLNHDPNGSTLDYWVVKLDSLGNLEWQKTLGGTSDDYGECIRQISDSSFIVAGSTESDDGDVIGHNFQTDYWIVKLGYAPKDEVAFSGKLPNRSFNYPNPFTEKTTIIFAQPINSNSTLFLYNLLGEQMQKVIIPIGSENVLIDRRGLSSGVYVYRVMSEGIMILSGDIIVK